MNDTKPTAPAETDRPARIVTRVHLDTPLPRKKRVAAYARVSADKDTSLHSLAAQVSHYSSYIQSRKGWVYAGVYADEGISGTHSARPGFQRLLQDCRAGRIDMVLVKSISRFSRNTLTTLETMRELKGLGIDIFFEEEHIHSLSGEGELLLTILASYAQAEAQAVSENCKWRIRKKFEAGIPVCSLLYGFRIKRGQFTVVPEEAAVIREIFSLYLSGMGRTAIAALLNERGIAGPGGGQWHPARLYIILHNEKYAGDLLMQKYYIKDYLTKERVKNKGERTQYSVENDHTAIVPRALFDQVQAEMARRAEIYSPTKNAPENTDGQESLKRPDGKYLFTGIITCGICGRSFSRRRVNSGTIYSKAAWVCSGYSALGKKACASRRVPEDVLIPIIARLLDVPECEMPRAVSRIDRLTIFPDGRVDAVIDGQERTAAWANASRRDSWDDERRKHASEKMKDAWKRRKDNE